MTCLRVIMTMLAVAFPVAAATGCGVSYESLPPGSFAGRAPLYDYSPSAMQSGNVLQLWWCGADYNPELRSQFTDSIQYESFDLGTNQHYGPFPVLGETQGAWDSVFTCNPRVVAGSFVNPLGNGATYRYAMYYVALGTSGNNRIGVAFSNDGRRWKKYPNPILAAATEEGYGVGQPTVLNTDHHSAIRMFYEDDSTSVLLCEAISSDGVHFTRLGTLTTNGLDAKNPPNWGDMSFDPVTGYWYAGFNSKLRDTSTTGGVQEIGQYGIELYRIPDASVLSGATPWQLVTHIDTNLTGYEANFLPSFLHDPYGNINIGPYPSIKMFTSISSPQPPWNASPTLAAAYGSISYWDIGTATWVANQPLRALNRYRNQTTHEVTTGWIDPIGGFSLETTLGHLYESPQQGATVAFFGCKSGDTDYFVSVDELCAGARILGINGYGYAQPVAGLTLNALYRCSVGGDDFVSKDPGCEGKASGQLLGYTLP